MKKKLLIGLSVLAASAALVGGTYAYLTDAEEDTNVFTIGNVDIDLLSAVGDEPIKLMPNNTEKTKVDYQIENIGNEDAYVWLRVKVPSALEDTPGLAANNIIHWNYLGAYMNGNENVQKYIDSATAQGYPAPVEADQTWIHLDGVYGEEINGEYYNVYDILYVGKLAADEVTTVGVSTVYMDQRVDYIDETDNGIKDGFWALITNGGTVEPIDHDFDEGANFIVEAHAIQANGFENVEEAYAAYNAQWANNEDGTKLTVQLPQN